MPKIRFVRVLILAVLPAYSCSTDRGADITTAPWVTSDDGQLALRIAVDSTVVERHRPIVLIAELANHGNNVVRIIGPFADSYRAESVGVALQGPNGPLKYTGRTLDYTLGGTLFHPREPGQSLTGRLELKTDNFAGCDAPGEYSLIYTYKYGGEWDHVDGGKSAWRGDIVSNPVTLIRR